MKDWSNDKACWNCRNQVWYPEENHYECVVYSYGAECHHNPSKPLWKPVFEVLKKENE